VDDKKILQPKAIARVRSANCARILINDLIAILPDGSSLEIRGKISNSSMRTLIKERRLHKDLVATTTATEEEEGGFVIAEEDEVDVDTI